MTTFATTVAPVPFGAALDAAFAAALTHASSANYFQSQGAIIDRFGGRVFIGLAAANDGNFPNVAADWLTTFQVGIGDSGSIITSQAAILSQTLATQALNTLTVGVDSASLTSAGNAVAFNSFAINRNTSFAAQVWAGYFEAHRLLTTSGTATAAELEVRNTAAAIGITPYIQNAGSTIALQLGAGAGVSSVGQFNATAAINIQPNPMKFSAGIVIGNGSIADPGNGVLPAMELYKGTALQWYTSQGTGTPSAFVWSTIATAANATGICFTDVGFEILTVADASILFQVPALAAAVNHVEITAATTGNAPQVAAVGTDTNINLKLAAQGASGLIALASPAQFANAGSFSANASVATSLGSIGPAGSHTTVQTWLTFQDNTGTTRYVPCF